MIKVCGMRDPENIRELSMLPIDLIGGIFYSKSPRYIGDRTDTARAFSSLPDTISAVGVFVNEDLAVIEQQKVQFNLKYLQLHGNESPLFCEQVSRIAPVFKAFGLSEQFDFSILAEYENSVVLVNAAAAIRTMSAGLSPVEAMAGARASLFNGEALRSLKAASEVC